MIDGGVWANNPVMNALVDVLACYEVPRENIRILTIGTGESKFTVDENARNGGAATWAFMRCFNAAARHSLECTRAGLPVSRQAERASHRRSGK